MRNALTLGVYNHAECFQHVELFWLLKGISTSISSIILLSFSMEDLILIDELEWLNLSNLTLEYIAQKWIIMNFHREFQIISQNSQIISMSKQLRPGKKIVMALIIWNWKIHAGGGYSFFFFFRMHGDSATFSYLVTDRGRLLWTKLWSFEFPWCKNWQRCCVIPMTH